MLDSSSDTPEEKLLVWCRQSVRGWDIIYDLCYLFLEGFWYFKRLRRCKIQVNLRNPTKFMKTHEIPGNSLEIISNTCLCDIKLSETYLGYQGCLLSVNLRIYLETLSQKQANNVPKFAGIDNVAKNWALAMMKLKALLLAHFSMVLLVKEQTILSLK